MAEGGQDFLIASQITGSSPEKWPIIKEQSYIKKNNRVLMCSDLFLMFTIHLIFFLIIVMLVLAIE